MTSRVIATPAELPLYGPFSQIARYILSPTHGRARQRPRPASATRSFVLTASCSIVPPMRRPGYFFMPLCLLRHAHSYSPEALNARFTRTGLRYVSACRAALLAPIFLKIIHAGQALRVMANTNARRPRGSSFKMLRRLIRCHFILFRYARRPGARRRQMLMLMT